MSLCKAIRLRRRIETNITCKYKIKSKFVTGGFDMPFAVASGYSTTDIYFLMMLHHCLQKLHTSQHLPNSLLSQCPDVFA